MTMKHIVESEKRSFSEYQGKAVSEFKAGAGKTAVEYAVEYDQYENPAELRESGNWPNDGEVLKFVNTKLKNAAVASSYQEAITPFKAEFDASPEKARKDFISAAMRLPGMTEDKAIALYESAS
jgi:hypothetical protein